MPKLFWSSLDTPKRMIGVFRGAVFYPENVLRARLIDPLGHYYGAPGNLNTVAEQNADDEMVQLPGSSAV